MCRSLRVPTQIFFRKFLPSTSNDMPRKICEGERNPKEGKKFSQFSWKMCIKLVGSFWKKIANRIRALSSPTGMPNITLSVQKWRLHNFFRIFAWPPMETIYMNIGTCVVWIWHKTCSHASILSAKWHLLVIKNILIADVLLNVKCIIVGPWNRSSLAMNVIVAVRFSKC